MKKFNIADLFCGAGGTSTIFSVANLSERMNISAMNALLLYKNNGLWCFDQTDMGIIEEPFVEGMDTIIDFIADREAPGHDEVVLSWGNEPKYRWSLSRLREEKRSDGTWNLYALEQAPLEGWLCPVLLEFFPIAPPVLNFGISVPTPALRILAGAAPSALNGASGRDVVRYARTGSLPV